MHRTMNLHEIGRRIRDLTDQHGAIDAAVTPRPVGASADAAEREMSDLLDQVSELERAALRGRARSLSDALAQSAACFHEIERLLSNRHYDATSRTTLARVLHAQASVIGCLEGFLGIEVDTVSWVSTGALCRTELLRVGSAADGDAPGGDPADVAAVKPDADLVAMSAELRGTLRLAKDVGAMADAVGIGPALSRLDSVRDFHSEAEGLAVRIVGTEAATPAGVAAVARAALALTGRDAGDTVRVRDAADALAWRVVDLVAAGMGRA